MTPKEKAQELYNKYAPYMLEWDGVDKWAVKECALIAVEFSKEFITGDLSEQFDKFIYLQDIKEEIEKL